MTTSEQQPWPEELRVVIRKAIALNLGIISPIDFMAPKAINAEPVANTIANNVLAAIAESPYTVVRRDEYEAVEGVEPILVRYRDGANE